MKTSKLLILVIAAAITGMLIPAAVSAHGRVSVGVGIGYYGGHYRHHGHWGGHYWGWPYCSEVVFVDPFPDVIVERPVVVKEPIVVVPQQSYPEPVYDGLDKIRLKKTSLLSQLEVGGKTERLYAISELAGFSFDEQVKAELEKILLSDPDAAMRKEAALSFGKIKNQGALGVLEKVRVADSDKEVREAADWAIKQIKS